jgi:hypothetical protein
VGTPEEGSCRYQQAKRLKESRPSSPHECSHPEAVITAGQGEVGCKEEGEDSVAGIGCAQGRNSNRALLLLAGFLGRRACTGQIFPKLSRKCSIRFPGSSAAASGTSLSWSKTCLPDQPQSRPGQPMKLILGIFHGEVPTTKKSVINLPTGPDYIVQYQQNIETRVRPMPPRIWQARSAASL